MAREEGELVDNSLLRRGDFFSRRDSCMFGGSGENREREEAISWRSASRSQRDKNQAQAEGLAVDTEGAPPPSAWRDMKTTMRLSVLPEGANLPSEKIYGASNRTGG